MNRGICAARVILRKFSHHSALISNSHRSSLQPLVSRISRCAVQRYRGVNTIPGVKTGGEKLVLMFTCNVCETRSAKTISKGAYERGVVVVICPKCSSKHLIADHHGIFEEKGWTIDRFLANSENGRSKYVTDDNILELTAEDIIGIETENKKRAESIEDSTPKIIS